MVLCLNFLRLPQPPSPKHVGPRCSRRRAVINTACTFRPSILVPTRAVETGLRVFVVSDLHTDYYENMAWVRGLSRERHKNNVLLVAGDVAETCKNFISTMLLLKDRFAHVFYVPGNHDLWCRHEDSSCFDSLQKLDKLLDACQRIGVETKPVMLDGLGIIPLFSWYHESFDQEMDVTGYRIPSLEMVIHFPSPCMQGLSCMQMAWWTLEWWEISCFVLWCYERQKPGLGQRNQKLMQPNNFFLSFSSKARAMPREENAFLS